MNLKSIGGSLQIMGNDSLVDLSGLENLATVGGDIIITGNPVLTSLAGLENINTGSVDSLNISDNVVLENCNIQSICSYLAAPNGTVDIYSNGPGCNNPAEIADKCGISLPCLPFGNYYLFTQAEIDSFPADYPGCKEIKGSVSITGYDIANLDGLNAVTSIGGNLVIGCYGWGYRLLGNPELTSIAPLRNLTRIGGSLWIIYNDTLSSLAGLDSLAFIGGDLLINMGFVHSSRNYDHVLASIDALGDLHTIGGDLFLAATSVPSLSGLNSLTKIGRNILIGDNNALKDLTGLGNLPFVRGELRITNNSALTTLSGLENIPFTEGGLFIDLNGALTSLTGLEGLHFIGGGLMIKGNDSITNLSGLNSLHSIVGGIEFFGNKNLATLAGLESLSSIDGTLTFRENPLLTSLDGIENIRSNSITSIDLRDNISLSACAVKSICDYIVGPESVLRIVDNAGGCNDIPEVKAACDHMSVDDPVDNSLFSVYPNPVSTVLTVEVPGTLDKIWLAILNMNGKELTGCQLHLTKTHVDVSNLPRGVYLLKLLSEKGTDFRKIIKL